jgi:hypothetical protein
MTLGSKCGFVEVKEEEAENEEIFFSFFLPMACDICHMG